MTPNLPLALEGHLLLLVEVALVLLENRLPALGVLLEGRLVWTLRHYLVLVLREERYHIFELALALCVEESFFAQGIVVVTIFFGLSARLLYRKHRVLFDEWGCAFLMLLDRCVSLCHVTDTERCHFVRMVLAVGLVEVTGH